jgi:hypothetical protein
MTWPANHRWTLDRLLKPLMVICVLMLAVGPIADSLLCGFEAGEAGSVQLLADASDHDESEGGSVDHAVCAHGHCHHPAPITASTEFPVGAIRYGQSERLWLATLQPPSNFPPSLKRPPRV